MNRCRTLVTCVIVLMMAGGLFLACQSDDSPTGPSATLQPAGNLPQAPAPTANNPQPPANPPAGDEGGNRFTILNNADLNAKLKCNQVEPGWFLPDGFEIRVRLDKFKDHEYKMASNLFWHKDIGCEPYTDKPISGSSWRRDGDHMVATFVPPKECGRYQWDVGLKDVTTGEYWPVWYGMLNTGKEDCDPPKQECPANADVDVKVQLPPEFAASSRQCPDWYPVKITFADQGMTKVDKGIVPDKYVDGKGLPVEAKGYSVVASIIGYNGGLECDRDSETITVPGCECTPCQDKSLKMTKKGTTVIVDASHPFEMEGKSYPAGHHEVTFDIKCGEERSIGAKMYDDSCGEKVLCDGRRLTLKGEDCPQCVGVDLTGKSSIDGNNLVTFSAQDAPGSSATGYTMDGNPVSMPQSGSAQLKCEDSWSVTFKAFDGQKECDSLTLSEKSKPCPGECKMLITKDVDKSKAQEGDDLTYTIYIKNVGTANCTGGGVKVTDLPPSEVSYGGPTSWNFGVVEPGEDHTVHWTGTIKKTERCDDYFIKNQAKVWSREEGTVQSNVVSTRVDVECQQVCDLPGSGTECFDKPLGSEEAECGYFGLVPIGKDDDLSGTTHSASRNADLAIVKDGAPHCYKYYSNVSAGDTLSTPNAGTDTSHVTYCACPTQDLTALFGNQ